ncbi:FG-GAP-like repeat-containing protein [Novipirellula rosea]|uniref:FG-GAP-like repeat-containing protein n=1 Tax=Novipirellula rosea TaxID=1031540 RepID=A0ABP8NJT2_9BACT
MIPVVALSRTPIGARYLFGFILLLTGCGGAEMNSTPPPVDEPQTPLQAMDAAIRLGRWEQAWQWSDEVLIAHQGDPDVLAKVARVAFENKQGDVAAHLLVDANRADDFQNPDLVQQATIALISVGQLFEALEMLEEVAARHPQQHQSRRLLFDFLIVIEDRDAAIEHGRELVRQRKFDFDLLLLLSNYEKRTLDTAALNVLMQRNPADNRPLIGEARKQFDLGMSSQAVETLRPIVQSHPQFLPAQILLGRALVDSGQFDQLDSWSDGLAGDYESTWGYWMVLGDWARYQGKTSEAAGAYWQATQRNPDVVQIWSKLNAALSLLQKSDPGLTEVSLPDLERRASLLSRFRQQKDRFANSGSQSIAIIIEIVETLRDLGRVWEAEAWAAMAMTLPDHKSTRIGTLRDSLIARLNRSTPWQTSNEHSELRLDLSNLPLPSFSGVATVKATPPRRIAVASVQPDLRNEATQRGLNFFGKTADQLDQPGIMFYATLGCGGGSIDFDLDGWTDLYLSAAGGTPPQRDSDANALMRNIAGNFVDATETSGTGDTGFGQGVAVGDVNEDGFPDLLVLNYGENRLLVNQGDGTFADVSERVLGNPVSQWSSSGAIADLNGDGLSDLIVVNYCAGLSPVTDACANAATGESRACSPLAFAGEPDVFMLGTEDGVFVDVDQDRGIRPSLSGRGLGVAVGSLDADNGIDALIVNDMSNNHYWSRSPGEKVEFEESAMLRGVAYDDRSLPQGSMGIATADFDADGDIDFYVTNFEHEYNTYYEQRDAGIWQDRTAQQQLATTALPMVGFGTEAVDFDNDGVLELAVTNGHVDFFPERDGQRSEYYQPMQIFHRTPTAGFEQFTDFAADEYLGKVHAGRALWTIDANRDGRCDLVVTHQTEPVALLVNRTVTKHHWIAVRLVGRHCARDAIGAVITLRQGNQSWRKVLTSGDGYLCSNERVIRFGLGGANAEALVTIEWPDGSTQTTKSLSIESEWLLVQGEPAFKLPCQ